MKFLDRLLNREKPKRYYRHPGEDFALKRQEYEYTFAKRPLAKGFALTSATEVEQMLEANKINPDVQYSRPQLVDDGKGYGMWMTRIDSGEKGVNGYGLLIPAFEDCCGTKRVIVVARSDYNPPEANRSMLLEDWGHKNLMQSISQEPDLEIMEKAVNIYNIPVYGYNSRTKTLYQSGTRVAACEEGLSFTEGKINRVIKREAVAFQNQQGRQVNR